MPSGGPGSGGGGVAVAVVVVVAAVPGLIVSFERRCIGGVHALLLCGGKREVPGLPFGLLRW